MAETDYVVFHEKKQTGSGGGLSAHIQREVWDNDRHELTEYTPESVINPERTALNKEYILAPGQSRTTAIEQRIKEAGITRKIKDDAVKSICILCTSNHDKMAEIEKSGKLDEWANDCIEYCRKEFGAKNVVSAVLHMDEKTPHLHITVVPIIEGQAKERKKRPKIGEDGRTIPEKPKRTIKKQQVTARLCANDIMTPKNMSRRQTEFAAAMEKWGMVRGIEGSNAKHQDSKAYNKLQKEIEQLEAKRDAIQADIADLTAIKAGKRIFGIGTKSPDREELVNLLQSAKEEIKALKDENKALQADSKARADNHKAEVEKIKQKEEETQNTLKHWQNMAANAHNGFTTLVLCQPGADLAMDAISQACKQSYEDGKPVSKAIKEKVFSFLQSFKEELKQPILKVLYSHAPKTTSPRHGRNKYDSNVLKPLERMIETGRIADDQHQIHAHQAHDFDKRGKNNRRAAR